MEKLSDYYVSVLVKHGADKRAAARCVFRFMYTNKIANTSDREDLMFAHVQVPALLCDARAEGVVS